MNLQIREQWCMNNYNIFWLIVLISHVTYNHTVQGIYYWIYIFGNNFDTGFFKEYFLLVSLLPCSPSSLPISLHHAISFEVYQHFFFTLYWLQCCYFFFNISMPCLAICAGHLRFSYDIRFAQIICTLHSSSNFLVWNFCMLFQRHM